MTVSNNAAKIRSQKWQVDKRVLRLSTWLHFRCTYLLIRKSVVQFKHYQPHKLIITTDKYPDNISDIINNNKNNNNNNNGGLIFFLSSCTGYHCYSRVHTHEKGRESTMPAISSYSDKVLSSLFPFIKQLKLL